MRILLHNFRSHIETEIVLQDGLIHFIKGDSGTGKSTIFQAILWVLYGKEQLVHNVEHPNQRMWVELELDGYKVYRQKGPGLLKVTLDNQERSSTRCGVDGVSDHQEYKDYLAQGLINQHFGEHDVWIASSYLMQWRLHPFLDYNQKERMLLLNHIAFSGEDPTPRLSKLDEKISECESQIKTEEITYNVNLSNFERRMKEQKINKKNHLSSEEILVIQSSITEYESKISNLQHQIQDLTLNVNRHQALQDQLKQLQVRLKSITDVYPNLNESQLIDMKEKRDQYLEYNKKKTYINSIISQRNNIKLEHPIPLYTPSDISNARHQTELYNTNCNLAKRLSIAYDPVVIQQEITRLQSSVDCQWMFSVHRHYKQLQERISSLITTNNRISPTLITEQQVQFMVDNLNCQWMFGVHADAARINKEIEVLVNANKSISLKQLTLDDLHQAQKVLDYQWVFAVRKNLMSLQQQLDTKLKQLSSLTPVTEQEVQQLTHVLNSQWIFRSLEQKTELERQLNEIKLSPVKHDIPTYQQELVDLERSKSCEHCPACNIPLSIVRGKVQKYSGTLYDESKVEKLKSLIEEATMYCENEKRANILKSQIASLNIGDFTNIYKIDNIVAHQERIQQGKQYLDLCKEIDFIKGEMSKNKVVDLPEGVIELVDTRPQQKYIADIHGYLNNENRIEHHRQQLEKIVLPVIPSNFHLVSDIPSYQRQITNYNSYLQNVKSIEQIEMEKTKIELPSIPLGITEYPDITQIKLRLEEIRKIVFTDKPTLLPEYMEKCIEWHRLDKLYQEEKMEEFLSSKPIPEVTQDEIDKVSTALVQIGLLTQQIRETEERISDHSEHNQENLEKMNQELLQYQQQRKDNIEKIEVSAKTGKMLEEHALLMKKCDELDLLKQRLVDLQEFKLLCKDAECKALSQLVESLNVFINSFASSLFDDPIRIDVSLFTAQKKKVRGKNIEKQKVHLEIRYKGGNFTDAKQLSGGECERISLILCLAFNRVVGSNLLILDEATGSLDGERKDDCFETIRQYMTGKTIIMTNHEGHVGYYDNIVELK